MQTGTLYGIGVGPGDPELMTVKAYRRIEMTKVLLLPSKEKEKCMAYSITRKLISEVEEKELMFCDFPMTKDQKILEEAQNQVVEKVCSKLEQGQDIAFLTIGDPSIYSTFQYISSKVAKQGYTVEMISGVPSFCAVAASLGISLADQEEEIHIIPGSYQLEESFELKGTKIYMKSGRKLEELKAYLKEKANSQSFQFYALANCGLPNQIICQSLDDLKPDLGYFTIVIVKDKAGD